MRADILPPGVMVSLAELLEMRHHLNEVQLFSRRGQNSPLIGLHHSRLRGRGVDFDQVRVYQAGDDVRSIDWRVTARTQVAHTKLFHEERERPVFLLIEQSPRLFFGSGLCLKSVLAARIAALFGWAALAHNDRIGGLVFDELQSSEVRPRRSKQSLLQLLARVVRANQQLASRGCEMGDGDGLGLALRRAREVLRPGSMVVIICDERSLQSNAEQQFALLARHCELVLLPLSDPLDHALPAAGLLRFTDEHARLELDTGDAALRQRWRERGELSTLRWQRLALKLGVLLLPLSTQRDLIDQLRTQVRPYPQAQST